MVEQDAAESKLDQVNAASEVGGDGLRARVDASRRQGSAEPDGGSQLEATACGLECGRRDRGTNGSPSTSNRMTSCCTRERETPHSRAT